MDKIISISDEIVIIGTAQGGIEEVRRCDLTFEPHVGDYVECFRNESNVIVSKAPAPARTDDSTLQGGGAGSITVNVSNASNNAAPDSTIQAAGRQGKVVNKVVYIVLALFLGGFGAHKFYAGKTGAGVIYIVFCWTLIPAIIAFVEMIIAITKKSDANGNIVV